MRRSFDTRAFQQRLTTLTAILEDLGDVAVQDTRRGARARAISLAVSAPGLGLPTTAVFHYEEAFERIRSGWTLRRYTYEYREVPGPGRRAHHWHDDVFHMHCVDARHPARDHHYRGYEVDVFEAHEEFARSYASGERVNCAGLRPPLPL